MGGIVPFAIQLLSALPGLLASGAQAIALIQAHTDALKTMVAENRSPTQDEWNALNATIGGLEAQLDAPLDTATTVASAGPAVAPAAEPVVEPVVAPAAEPVVEPVVAPAAEPVAEPVVEPIVPAAPVAEPLP